MVWAAFGLIPPQLGAKDADWLKICSGFETDWKPASRRWARLFARFPETKSE